MKARKMLGAEIASLYPIRDYTFHTVVSFTKFAIDWKIIIWLLHEKCIRLLFPQVIYIGPLRAQLFE